VPRILDLRQRGEYQTGQGAQRAIRRRQHQMLSLARPANGWQCFAMGRMAVLCDGSGGCALRWVGWLCFAMRRVAVFCVAKTRLSQPCQPRGCVLHEVVQPTSRGVSFLEFHAPLQADTGAA